MNNNKYFLLIFIISGIILLFSIIVITIIILRFFFIVPVKVEGKAMEPALKENQLVLLKKHGKIKRDSIVAIKYHDNIIFSRVVNLPNEETERIDYVDPITLGSDEYFVLGDNLEIAIDSRNIGPINKKDIIGVIK